MGKRRTNKNKKKNANIANEENNKMNEDDNKSLSNLQTILDKINSEYVDDREAITNLLCSYQFMPTDIKMKEIVKDEIFLKALVSLLNDNYYQIKYNVISAIINIIVSFDENDIESLILLKTNLLELSINIIKEYINFDKNSQEHINVVRIIQNLFDLYILLIDLYNENTYKDINFFPFINEILNLLINQKQTVSEEVNMKINLLFNNYLSVIIYPVSNENILIKKYIDESYNYIQNNNTKENIINSDLLKTIYCSNLFYLVCTNNTFFIENKIDILPKLIEFLYTKIINLQEIDKLSDLLSSLDNEIVGLDGNKNKNDKDDEEMDEKENKKINENIKNNDEEIKGKIKFANDKINTFLICLKTFEDLIENVNISNNNDDNMEEEKIDEEYEEIEDDDKDVNIESNENNKANNFEELLEKSIRQIISVNNYEPFKKMLNVNFMECLNKYCQIITNLNEFFVDGSDKLLMNKENLEEIQNISLSMINNIIFNFSSYIENIINNEYIENLFLFLVKEIKHFESIKNFDNLETFVVCLRNLIEKSKSKIEKFNFSADDYLFLYQLIQEIKDPFIKCNIIDIISMMICKNNNYKEGEKLKQLFFVESNIEVLSHLVNSFMDIFTNDDLESNKFLKEINLINLMSQGLNQFKLKIKESKKEGELDKESESYVKETLVNMKRFIKYKNESFVKLKIN